MTTQETRTLPSRRQVLMSASSKRGEDDLDAAMLKVEATKKRWLLRSASRAPVRSRGRTARDSLLGVFSKDLD